MKTKSVKNNQATSEPEKKRKASRPIKPVPEQLQPILDLVNQLPIHFRHPYWARDKKEGMFSAISMEMKAILEYREGALSEYGEMILRTGIKAEFPVLATHTPRSLWYCLQNVLRDLPTVLQAFVLNDREGMMEGETNRVFVSMPEAIQVSQNLNLSIRTESELKTIIRSATDRTSNFLLSQSPMGEVPIGGTNAAYLLERARQRLIYVMAAQELLSCLTHPDAWNKVLFGRRVHLLSSLLQPRISILQTDAGEGRSKRKAQTLMCRLPEIYLALEGIEADRIRECKVCYKIFWAGRKDVSCCSARCGKINNTRKWRENRPLYEEARQKREHAKKAQSKDKRRIK